MSTEQVKENAIDIMNEALAGLITKAVSGAEAAGDFLLAEVPEVIHQLLLWKTVSLSLTTLTFLMLVLLCIYLIGKVAGSYSEAVRSENKSSIWVDYIDYRKRYEPSVCTGLSFILITVCIVFLSIGFFSNGGGLLKIWLAPKVWLLEYGAALVK